MPSIPQDYGRMEHFHDTYAGNEREIGWTHNLSSATTSASSRSRV